MVVSSVGVVGAGTMGSGIAQSVAVAGLNVVMVDLTETALAKGISTLTRSLERLVGKGKMSAASRDDAMGRIETTTDYQRLATMDLVIEAATENEELKVRILQRIEQAVGAKAIIASNTSSISITSLGATLKEPSHFVGMHFFNPVPILPLVEIIRGVQTSDDAVESVRELALLLEKSPIIVKNSPGFVVNRVLIPMINEAFFVLAEGVATAEEIDVGMRLGANHPMGPLALADLIGLDVCLSVMDVFAQDYGDSKYRACPRLRELVSAGHLGRKAGRGVYRYAVEDTQKTAPSM